MNKKEKNPYANCEIKQITKPNKATNDPSSSKKEGGDLRVKGGK